MDNITSVEVQVLSAAPFTISTLDIFNAIINQGLNSISDACVIGKVLSDADFKETMSRICPEDTKNIQENMLEIFRSSNFWPICPSSLECHREKAIDNLFALSC